MPTDEPSDIRSQILQSLRPVAAAWSVNGRDVHFVGDFDMAVRRGGFLAVTTPAGRRLLVQVHDMGSSTRRGVRVEVDTGELGIDDGPIRHAEVDVVARVVEGTGLVLATLDDPVPDAVDGFDQGALSPATDDEIDAYLSSQLGTSAGLEIGRLRDSAVPARLKASGFARHTFLCGQSGSGKTFSLGVVLERLLLETDLPLVVIDPNSDYVNLGRMAGRTAVNRFRSTAMSRDEYDVLVERYAARADVVVASAKGGDLPLLIHLSDLTLDEQALVLQVDPIVDADEFSALRSATRSLGPGPYGPDELAATLQGRFDDASRRVSQRIENLGISGWSIWAGPDERSLAGTGLEYRATILDTGSLSDARERSVVALALLGRLRSRPKRRPVSVVIDEAHNVCPPDASSRLDLAVTDHARWIAGEGRKFGIYLVLSTQRPQKIHRNVLSQCDNLLLMRVNSTSDLAEIAEVFSHVPASLVAEAKSHSMGEMLAAGPISPTPVRLQVAERWTKEGGADIPATWSRSAG
jgi:DNA helicase HerA-like ATPase